MRPPFDETPSNRTRRANRMLRRIGRDRRSPTGAWITTRRRRLFAIVMTTAPALLAAAQDSPPTTQPAGAQSQSASARGDGDAPRDPPFRRSGEDDIGLLDLEIPTVVTASRREQKATSLPYAANVITADDIRRAGARSVADALRLVPGVDVAEISAGVTAVSPRGFHAFYSNKTLVLVDGRQIYDGESGGTLWANWPFMLEDIDRIEVIRGPGGVTWGANAVNGVINIITKDPSNQMGLTTIAEGGSRGTHRAYAGYGFTDRKLRMRISGEYDANDGFFDGGASLRALDDNYKAGRAGLHGVFDAGPDDRITFSGGSAIVDGGFTPSLFAAPRVQNPGTQADFASARWDHKLSRDSSINVSGYVNDFALDQGTKSTDTRYQQYGLSVGWMTRPSSSHTLTFGVDGRADSFDATNSDPRLLSQRHIGNGLIGLYAQDEWRFARRWALNLGGRLDYDFYGGVQPSARCSLSFEPSEHALVWGAVSRAYQMATPALRKLDTPVFAGIGTVVADRDLDAVQLLAYELGYRTRLFERLEFSADAFWHEYAHNYGLAGRAGPPGLFQLRTEEVADASLYGAEVDARVRVTEQFRLLANYTFQNLNWRSEQAFTTSQDTPLPPRHKFMIGAQFDPLKNLHLSSHVYFVDATRTPNPESAFNSRDVDAYFRLDLRAEYEFWDRRASVAAGVRNLLDPSHAEATSAVFRAAEAPRIVYMQLKLQFK